MIAPASTDQLGDQFDKLREACVGKRSVFFLSSSPGLILALLNDRQRLADEVESLREQLKHDVSPEVAVADIYRSERDIALEIKDGVLRNVRRLITAVGDWADSFESGFDGINPRPDNESLRLAYRAYLAQMEAWASLADSAPWKGEP